MQFYMDAAISMLPSVSVIFNEATLTGNKGTVKNGNLLTAAGLQSNYVFSIWLSKSIADLPDVDDVVEVDGVEYAVDKKDETAVYRRLDLKSMSAK